MPRRLSRWLVAGALLIVSAPAFAGQEVTLTDEQGRRVGTSLAPFAAADPNNAPYSVATPITVGAAAIAAGRSVAVNCTVAGNVTFTLAGGGSYTVPVVVGYQTFPFAVTGVSASTATATYANLN